MLLDRFPQIGRAYVMVRRGSGTDSEARFWKSVVTSPAFDPLRDKHGGKEGLATFLREKVVVVDGDITEPNLGLSEEAAERVAKDIDVLINSSGRVTFNPPLESALRTNVEGTKNVIAFAKRMKRPALIHTSTCFVAGNRSGEVWEDEELDGYFPRHKELPGTRFSVEQEMADNAQGAARIRQLPTTPRCWRGCASEARDRLRDEKPRSRRRSGAEAGRGPLAQGVDPRGDDQAGHRAGRDVGLAQHLHVHEEHGRPAGRARDRHRARRSCGPPSSSARRLSVPGVERGLHDVGAAGLPGAQGQNVLPVRPS